MRSWLSSLARRLTGLLARRSVRSGLVAAFVVFHLAAVFVDAIPSIELNPKAWRRPRVHAELAAWARRLSVPEAAFEDLLWRGASGMQSAREVLALPFRPYLWLSGLHERWALFAAGSVNRAHLEIRGRNCVANGSECPWRTLYLRGDADHTESSALLEQTRMRSAIAAWGNGQRRGFPRGCAAIAQRVFREHAEVSAVSCRFLRSTTMMPDHPDSAWVIDDASETVVERAR